MRIKRAIDHLQRRVDWLTKKVEENPTHHYVAAELSATKMAIEALAIQKESIDAIPNVYLTV